jgi:hypothetical protein
MTTGKGRGDYVKKCHIVAFKVTQVGNVLPIFSPGLAIGTMNCLESQAIFLPAFLHGFCIEMQ